MRAYLPDYELRVPRDLSGALELLAREPGAWRPFAGGTDLMVLFEAGRLAHKRFISIRHLKELRGIEETPEHVTLGALTTYTEVQRSETLRRLYPMLCSAASETGGVAIQNRGTLGGNIANASPAADSPPALLAYGAELELVSASGARWVLYESFHTGYKQTIMRPEELVARVRLPRPVTGARQTYRKVGTRRAQAISKVCFAGLAELENGSVREIRLSFGSVAPIPLRCVRTETILRGGSFNEESIRSALLELSREIVPIDDVRSNAKYRLRVAENLLRDFLAGLKNEL